MEREKAKLPTLINDPLHPLTDAQIVDATLAFVNGADIALNRLEPGCSIEECISQARKFREFSTNEVERPFLDVPLAFGSTAELHSYLRNRVAVILGHALTDPAATAKVIDKDGFQLIPGYYFGSCNVRLVRLHSQSGYRLTSCYEFQNSIQLIELGLFLILAQGTGFRERLRRCKWNGCAWFFLIVKPETGRSKSHYCRSDCMEQLHNSRGAARMKKLRRARKMEKKAREARSA
jgi:hypothetical protein